MEKKRRQDLGYRMLKLLLIEDDPSMVSLLTTLLNLEGFIVKTPSTQNIEGWLKSIQHETLQIVLLDVNLSAGNGLDLVRRIRSDPEIKHIRILMTSGLNLKQECLSAGADDFIQKPFMPDELINLIHRISARETQN